MWLNEMFLSNILTTFKRINYIESWFVIFFVHVLQHSNKQCVSGPTNQFTIEISSRQAENDKISIYHHFVIMVFINTTNYLMRVSSKIISYNCTSEDWIQDKDRAHVDFSIFHLDCVHYKYWYIDLYEKHFLNTNEKSFHSNRYELLFL